MISARDMEIHTLTGRTSYHRRKYFGPENTSIIDCYQDSFNQQYKVFIKTLPTLALIFIETFLLWEETVSKNPRKKSAVKNPRQR